MQPAPRAQLKISLGDHLPTLVTVTGWTGRNRAAGHAGPVSPLPDWARTRVRGEAQVKSKIIQDGDVVTYVVVCDPGDEAMAALKQFARAERLEASQITGVGDSSAPPSAGSTTRPGGSATSRWTSPPRCCR